MKRILFIISVLMLSNSCEKDKFDYRYRFLYGEWTPKRIDTFYMSDLESFGNNLQIIENHRYKIFRNDTLLEAGKIDINEQTETSLKIRFIARNSDIYFPLEYNHMNRSELVVIPVSNDSIKMFSMATDGGAFGLFLSRKK